jgi:hypothetical protein
MEQWKEIVGYPGYKVSNLGCVIGFHGKILTGSKTQKGYKTVLLCPDTTTRKRLLIHRLVAEAFILNPDNKPTVDHIDRNKNNNCVENLRWATNHENNMNKDKINDSTEHHYIYTSYRVAVPGQKEKRFRALEDAIEYRNSLLNVNLTPLDTTI